MKSIEKEGVEGLSFIWKKKRSKEGLNFDMYGRFVLDVGAHTHTHTHIHHL